MRIIDLTLPIKENMPNYPTNPTVKIEQVHFLEKDNENAFSLLLNTQLGTHMETGYFVDNDLSKMSDIPATRFVGTAAVVDIPCRLIDPDDLAANEYLIRSCNFVLLRSGYIDNVRQITNAEISSKRRPYVSMKAAKWLVERGIALMGIDSFGFDPFQRFDVHKYLLENSVLIVEGVINLRKIKEKRVLLIALPLKIMGVEASPARVIAIEGAILQKCPETNTS